MVGVAEKAMIPPIIRRRIRIQTSAINVLGEPRTILASLRRFKLSHGVHLCAFVAAEARLGHINLSVSSALKPQGCDGFISNMEKYDLFFHAFVASVRRNLPHCNAQGWLSQPVEVAAVKTSDLCAGCACC